MAQFIGAINVTLFLPVTAASEGEAMELLGRLDLETVIDQAPCFDAVMDSEGRYFYLEPAPLPPPLDELDLAIRADVAAALSDCDEGDDGETLQH